MVAKYRKMHLFDNDLPGDEFKESEKLSPGNEMVSFTADGIKIGLGICHDLRFEEMAKMYRKDGMKYVILV